MTAAPRARRVVLSLGSNLGDRMEYLQGAVDALLDAPGLRFVAVSPVYETAPVGAAPMPGGGPQPDYLNAILIVDTSLPARTVLDRAQGAEDAFGRSREVRFGPRTLDVDIVAVGGETIEEPELTVPHPRAHERAFVLAPWRDLDPGAELPGRGPVADLLDAVGVDGVRRRDDLVLREPQ